MGVLLARLRGMSCLALSHGLRHRTCITLTVFFRGYLLYIYIWIINISIYIYIYVYNTRNCLMCAWCFLSSDELWELYVYIYIPLSITYWLFVYSYFLSLSLPIFFYFVYYIVYTFCYITLPSTLFILFAFRSFISVFSTSTSTTSSSGFNFVLSFFKMPTKCVRLGVVIDISQLANERICEPFPTPVLWSCCAQGLSLNRGSPRVRFDWPLATIALTLDLLANDFLLPTGDPANNVVVSTRELRKSTLL